MEDQYGSSVHGVVDQQLDTLETNVDTALENTVHELRHQTQKVGDQILNRWKQYWDEQSPKIEAYIASHPWQVLGGLVILGYLFSSTQRTLQPGATIIAR